MKKVSVVSILALLVLSINLISAFDLDVKSSYSPGETMQLEIPDAFIDGLRLENIGIYQNNSVHKTPAESGLIKSGESYFYYAILPKSSGEYSLKIEDAKYWEGSVEVTDTIIRKFSIVSTNNSYLSFNPGYLYVTDDFSIVVTAYNKPQNITVTFKPSNFEQNFKIGYGSAKTIYIPITNITEITKSEVKINNYALPITISPSTTEKDRFNLSGEDQLKIINSLEDIMDFYPEEIVATILPGKDYYYELKITNEINASIEDLIISSSDKEIEVAQNNISELKSHQSLVIPITLNSKEEKDAWINITYKNYSVFIPVLMKIAEEQSDVQSNVKTINQQKICIELGGVKCDSTQNQKCKGSESYAFDGWCCMDECKSSSSSAWIWGILIIVILAVGGWLLYNKSQKGLGAEKLKEIFKKRTDSYESRVKPMPPREVRGGLSKS